MPIFAKFDQHANQYDQATPIQTDVALFLAQKMVVSERFAQAGSKNNPCWADIGCGTGKLSQAVITKFLASDKSLPFTTLYGVDNSPAMLTLWQDNCQNFSKNLLNFQAIAANMQQLPFADKSLAGLMSSFALHWTDPSVIAELGRVVQQQGSLYLAIPVKGSFSQVRQRFPALPIFPFLCSSDWQHAIMDLVEKRQGDLHFLQVRGFNYLYPNLKVLLQELKSMGGAVSGQASMKPSQLRQYLNDKTPIQLDYQMLLVGLTLN